MRVQSLVLASLVLFGSLASIIVPMQNVAQAQKKLGRCETAPAEMTHHKYYPRKGNNPEANVFVSDEKGTRKATFLLCEYLGKITVWQTAKRVTATWENVPSGRLLLNYGDKVKVADIKIVGSDTASYDKESGGKVFFDFTTAN